METLTICVCQCIPEAEGTVPLPLTLFTVNNTEGNTVQTIDENTDESRPSVYSKGEGNCSPFHVGASN
jgi:hypothetical protein